MDIYKMAFLTQRPGKKKSRENTEEGRRQFLHPNDDYTQCEDCWKQRQSSAMENC
ncbi:unnamed protein product [Caretta caretta]